MISVDGVIGWLIPGDVDYLSAAAAELPPSPAILEIGSWMGLSATIFARTREDAVIHCVDTWEGGPEHVGMPELGSLYETFKRNVEPFGDRIVAYRMSSMEATSLLHGRLFDLIYIDGNHTEDGALADMDDCEPLLRPGGMMLVHDCVNEVRCAVRTFARARGFGYEVMAPPGANWMARILR